MKDWGISIKGIFAVATAAGLGFMLGTTAYKVLTYIVFCYMTHAAKGGMVSW